MAVEESSVLDFSLFQHRFDSLASFIKFELVDSWERKDTSRVNTNSFNSKLLGWKVTALYEERLVNVVGDSWVELDRYFETFISKNFASHVTAFNDALARESAQVNVELKRHLADVFNEEVSWLAFVVSNLTEVKIVRAEAEGDIVGLACDFNVVVGTTIDTYDSHTFIVEAISSVEGKLNIFRLSGLQDAADWQDIEDFVYWEVLLFLFVLLALSFVVSINLFLFIDVRGVF